MKTLTLTIVLMFLAITPTFAQEYANKDYSFALTLPKDKGWGEPEILTQSSGSLTKPIELILLSIDSSTGDKISLHIIDVDDDITMSNSEVRRGFKSGFTKKTQATMRLIDENVSKISGVDCYKLSLVGTLEGLPVNIRTITFNANGLQFILNSYTSDTTKIIDKSLEDILFSFRFTEPPQLPKRK